MHRSQFKYVVFESEVWIYLQISLSFQREATMLSYKSTKETVRVFNSPVSRTGAEGSLVSL